MVREFARKDAEVGLVNNPFIPVPLLDTPAHAAAAQKAFVRIGGISGRPDLQRRLRAMVAGRTGR